MIQKRTTEPSKNSVHAPWIHAAGISLRPYGS